MSSLWNCSCLYEEKKKILLFALDILRAESKNLLERIERKEIVGSIAYSDAFRERTEKDIKIAEKLIDEINDTPDCLN
ncbi:hypothetical protein LCGC14_1427010 [marine sediment metagenome]|uniref:HEPN domain-containing protein n=1 Tax=marine sediment metagenome TaxID=412755 RepID=A0A0F9KAV7_9ZZZZ